VKHDREMEVIWRRQKTGNVILGVDGYFVLLREFRIITDLVIKARESFDVDGLRDLTLVKDMQSFIIPIIVTLPTTSMAGPRLDALNV